jgi:hypothetical protein
MILQTEACNVRFPHGTPLTIILTEWDEIFVLPPSLLGFYGGKRGAHLASYWCVFTITLLLLLLRNYYTWLPLAQQKTHNAKTATTFVTVQYPSQYCVCRLV